MKLRIRLYYSHDMDLISLYRTGRISFPEATKQVLDAYADGEAFHLVTDPERAPIKPAKQAFQNRKLYYYDVTLNEEKDAAAVALIKDINLGRRASFVKTLLRQYLCCPIPSIYSISGNTELFDRMTEKFAGSLEERHLIREKRHGPYKTRENNALKDNLPKNGGLGAEQGNNRPQEEYRGNTIQAPEHLKEEHSSDQTIRKQDKNGHSSKENQSVDIAETEGQEKPQVKPSYQKAVQQGTKGQPKSDKEVRQPKQIKAQDLSKEPQSSPKFQSEGKDGDKEENVDSLLAEMMEEY